jgi:DNA-binding PucR family transcriptional regulator
VDGLRQSHAEAAAALSAAHALRRAGRAVAIDAVGMPRTMVEWLASDLARDGAHRLLEPLDALGPERARTAIETLQAYLDEQGSLVRSAARLHLHRNAVAYRMRGILERLDVDLADPDQRLALQLACRARLIDRAA